MRRFHRPREGSHGKQILAVGLRTKALPPNPAASCQPARPEDRNAVLCPLPLSLANSPKVRVVVSVILLSYFPKAQKHYHLFSAHHPPPREDWSEGKKCLTSHRALLAHSSPFLWDPSLITAGETLRGRREGGGTLVDGWEVCRVEREGTCCQSHFSTGFSCTFMSSQDSPLCPEGKGGSETDSAVASGVVRHVGPVPQASLPPRL